MLNVFLFGGSLTIYEDFIYPIFSNPSASADVKKLGIMVSIFNPLYGKGEVLRRGGTLTPPLSLKHQKARLMQHN